MTSDVWEPDALTAHVRICEGANFNPAGIPYCDTTTGNQWQTGNTNRILNKKEFALLTRSAQHRRLQMERSGSHTVTSNVVVNRMR